MPISLSQLLSIVHIYYVVIYIHKSRSSSGDFKREAGAPASVIIKTLFPTDYIDRRLTQLTFYRRVFS